MNPLQDENNTPGKPGLSSTGVSLMASMDPAAQGGCAQPADPREALERPGYKLQGYVQDFIPTDAGPIPRVKTRLEKTDWMATALVRCGIQRHQYTVVPGLYAVGAPDRDSEVLVTANFKLTFDQLREAVDGLDAWILVLDTRGVNVWCAAGKGTFATAELVNRVRAAELEKVVSHRRLIVPQLGATGVSAGEVKKRSGFRVVYGPVRAADIIRFLDNKRRADKEMRAVTFTFSERIILTPVEIQIVLKPALITTLVLFVLSGIGPGIFSFSSAWDRGLIAVAAMVLGLVSGAVITPALLPHIPVREFALKGIITGAVAGLAQLPFIPGSALTLSLANALVLFTIAISSFLAMNFTGATPFTAPSGVEKEMKRFIPVQLACLVLSAGFWIYSAF